MTDDRPATFEVASAPQLSLKVGAERIEALRADGELRVRHDTSAFESWRCRWAAGLEELRALCRSQAPLQSEMVMWPLVIEERTSPDNLPGLMRRAAIGCRELRLLADQVETVHPDVEIPTYEEALASSDRPDEKPGTR